MKPFKNHRFGLIFYLSILSPAKQPLEVIAQKGKMHMRLRPGQTSIYALDDPQKSKSDEVRTESRAADRVKPFKNVTLSVAVETFEK